MNLPSKAVHSGRNAERVAYRDDRYVRCGRCNHVVHLDRHQRAPYGSKAGQGITHSSPTSYNDDIPYNSPIGYNGYEPDFTITAGCPFCGALTYDKGERHGRFS